jgi:hypothetical protein
MTINIVISLLYKLKRGSAKDNSPPDRRYKGGNKTFGELTEEVVIKPTILSKANISRL